MRIPAALLFTCALNAIFAQSHPIGTRSIVFYDADRDRDVGSVVHYPAISAGTDVPAAEGEFPVIIFGHGFFMAVGAYENFRDHFVPNGYILVLPTTEGGLADHEAFGGDLAFLAGAMQVAGQDPGSAFYTHVATSTALLGHSMGGGASMLGAAIGPAIQTVVNFAAAETDPSAISAAGAIQVPVLMFAATEDCVTPVNEHQLPMYEALSVDCKAFVNIIGGGHCFFANPNAACDFGEFTCSPDLTISRAQQQAVVNDLASLWLDGYLKNDQMAFSAFLDSVALSTRVSAQSECLGTGLSNSAPLSSITVLPIPADHTLFINGITGAYRSTIVDVQGRVVISPAVVGAGSSIDIRGLPNGVYRSIVEQGGHRSVHSFVVLH